MAVGDAASVYDPIAGIGITKALANGLEAAKKIKNYFSGNNCSLDAYQMQNKRAFNSYIAKRRQYYCDEKRWPHSPFWQRRHVQQIC